MFDVLLVKGNGFSDERTFLKSLRIFIEKAFLDSQKLNFSVATSRGRSSISVNPFLTMVPDTLETSTSLWFSDVFKES